MIFVGIVRRAFERLESLTLTRQAINPYLAVLVARRPGDLAEFIVHQRVERGLVTSFGMQIQKIAVIVGENIRPSAVDGADLERVDPTLRRHTLIQLKSGPETINSSGANEIRNKLNSAERRLRNGGLATTWSVTKMLGMIYGTPSHRSSWVTGLGDQGLDIDKIGRDFWAFASGEDETYLELFHIAAEASAEVRDDHGRTLPEAIRDTVASLTTEIRAHYSDAQGDIDWTRLVEENM